MFDRIALALAGTMFSAIALFAFWPQSDDLTRADWCQQYPAACAAETGGAVWEQFVQDRQNGLR